MGDAGWRRLAVTEPMGDASSGRFSVTEPMGDASSGRFPVTQPMGDASSGRLPVTQPMGDASTRRARSVSRARGGGCGDGRGHGRAGRVYPRAVGNFQEVLDRYRAAAVTNREQGTYFEDLTRAYLTTEPAYRELYARVQPYAVWARERGLDARDTGIDLVAETAAGEVHAVQCKAYATRHRIAKADIDSLFTASGKKPFARRLIVTTTSDWSEHAEEALRDQQTPVTKIDLAALERAYRGEEPKPKVTVSAACEAADANPSIRPAAIAATFLFTFVSMPATFR